MTRKAKSFVEVFKTRKVVAGIGAPVGNFSSPRVGNSLRRAALKTEAPQWYSPLLS